MLRLFLVVISILLSADARSTPREDLKGENQVNIVGYYGNAGACAAAGCIPSLAKIHEAYNVIIFTFANFNSQNEMEFLIQGPYVWNKKQLKQDLASWKKKADPWGRSKHALISLGGQNGYWPNNVDAFIIDKLQTLCTTYGFDGIDVDFEGGSLPGVLKNLGAFKKLKSMGFMLTAAPEAAQYSLQSYTSLLPILNWAHPQFYNNGPNAVAPPFTKEYKGYASWQMNGYWAEVMDATADYLHLTPSQRGVAVPASTSAAGSYNNWNFDQLRETCKTSGIKNIATWAIGYDNIQNWKLAKALLPLISDTTPSPTNSASPTTLKPIISAHPTTAVPTSKHNGTPTYRVIYMDWKLNWSDMTIDLKTCLDWGFNVVILGFYLNGPADAAQQWTMLSEAQRNSAKAMFRSRNAKLMLSSGGATFSFDAAVQKGAAYGRTYCKQVSQWAVDHDFDGVDFDMELQPGNSKPLADGSAVDWLVECSKAAREVLGPNRLISHAPQGPYFGSWAGPKFGYTEVYKQAPTIDFFNVQYYNQGNVYADFESIFVKNKRFWNTAIMEIHKNGVPLNKLVVGKPASQAGASNGYISPSDLHNFGVQACNAYGWNAGFMGWMYSPGDQAVKNFGKNISMNLCSNVKSKKLRGKSRLLK